VCNVRGRATRLLLALLILLTACNRDGPHTQVQAYDYPTDAPLCAMPAPTPPVEAKLRIDNGLDVLVRFPTNYRATVAHRLLVVYAAAGMSPTGTERYTGYTPPATKAGYVVAYPQHLRPSLAAMRKLGQIPSALGKFFCIDKTKIFLTGHSDGGTAATAIAVTPETADHIAGIAPSAAGFTGDDLDAFSCPAPRPVIVWHGARDRLFPGWGRETARWWAGCNGCDLAQLMQTDDACIAYAGCTAPVRYCEGPDGHMTWPREGAARTLNFFQGHLNTSTSNL
jgi:polyhydroxybutyrate depolymerase